MTFDELKLFLLKEMRRTHQSLLMYYEKRPS